MKHYASLWMMRSPAKRALWPKLSHKLSSKLLSRLSRATTRPLRRGSEFSHDTRISHNTGRVIFRLQRSCCRCGYYIRVGHWAFYQLQILKYPSHSYYPYGISNFQSLLRLDFTEHEMGLHLITSTVNYKCGKLQ